MSLLELLISYFSITTNDSYSFLNHSQNLPTAFMLGIVYHSHNDLSDNWLDAGVIRREIQDHTGTDETKHKGRGLCGYVLKKFKSKSVYFSIIKYILAIILYNNIYDTYFVCLLVSIFYGI